MLKKLSLAALVAMGSMSFASATPLTQAIKNVNLNGMLRIRYYNIKPENKNGYSKWRTNAIFIFKVPVAENINFIFRNSTQTYLTHTESNNGKLSGSVDSTMANNLLFMNYHQDGLNAIAGKIPVATPITSKDPASPTHGAGAIATYNVGNGFTVAGGFVTAMKNVAVASNGGKLTKVDNYNYVGSLMNNDTYVLAGIYGSNAIKAQAWYFHIENLLKYDVIASADVDLLKLAGMSNNYDVMFHMDYAASKLEDNIQKALGSNSYSKNFWNVNVKGTVSGAALRVGYAHSSDDVGLIDLSYKSPLAYSQAAVQNFHDIADERDCSMIYADGSYNVTPAVKVGLAYAHVNTSSNSKKRYTGGVNLKNSKGKNIAAYKLGSDLNEYTAKVDYAYNKKLSFQGLYDYEDFKASGADQNEVRVQALYKF